MDTTQNQHADDQNAAPWVFVLPADAADTARCARCAMPMRAVAAPWQWSLRRDDDGALRLCAPAADAPLQIDIDLERGPMARRLQTARRDQPLARAIGLHRRATPPTVFDATAGLGRDALLLARLGCTVIACERLPPLALLLADAAERSGDGARVTVHCADAATVLATLGPRAIDVVYLDPMYPEHGRAQVKKEMQACRRLAGAPESPAVLLHRAFAAARERVVCKRHPHDAPLAPAPSFTVDGERVRFDVYLTRAVPTSAP